MMILHVFGELLREFAPLIQVGMILFMVMSFGLALIIVFSYIARAKAPFM